MRNDLILTAVIASGTITLTTTKSVNMKEAKTMIENYLNANGINYSSYANADTFTGNDGITTIYAQIELI